MKSSELKALKTIFSMVTIALFIGSFYFTIRWFLEGWMTYITHSDLYAIALFLLGLISLGVVFALRHLIEDEIREERTFKFCIHCGEKISKAVQSCPVCGKEQ